MKWFPIYVMFVSHFLLFDNSYAFDDNINFENIHKFRYTEIFQFTKLSDFNGEKRACFDIYNTKNEELAGWCIPCDQLQCDKFVKNKKYLVIFESYVSHGDPEFEYDNIDFIDIKNIN